MTPIMLLSFPLIVLQMQTSHTHNAYVYAYAGDENEIEIKLHFFCRITSMAIKSALRSRAAVTVGGQVTLCFCRLLDTLPIE
jgi:hypothetical protein